MSKGLGISSLSRGLLLHGNMKVIAFTSLMTGLYVSMLNGILQAFAVEGLGTGLFLLGILQAIGSRPLGLASSLVQPYSGHLADRIGRKRLIVAGSVVGIFAMISFLFAALFHSVSALGLGYLFYGLALLSSPATQAMVAESVAMDGSRLEIAFSVVFFFTSLPGAFATYLGGYVAQTYGYYLVFLSAALLETANLFVLATTLKETRNQPLPSKLGKSNVSLRHAFSLPPGLARIFIPFAMDAFFFGIGGSLIYGFWVQTFGFTAADTSLVAGTIALALVLAQYPATKFLRSVGIRKSLAFSELLTVLVMTGWLFSSSLDFYLLLAALFGVSIATWVPALNTLIMTRAPVEERGSVSGKLAAFRGILAVPAPIIGGFLFSAYGYYIPVAIGMLGEIGTTVALFTLIPRDASTGAG